MGAIEDVQSAVENSLAAYFTVVVLRLRFVALVQSSNVKNVARTEKFTEKTIEKSNVLLSICLKLTLLGTTVRL